MFDRTSGGGHTGKKDVNWTSALVDLFSLGHRPSQARSAPAVMSRLTKKVGTTSSLKEDTERLRGQCVLCFLFIPDLQGG